MIPSGKHTDWPWPLKYVPRRWTAVSSDTPPKVVCASGLDGHNPDVPPPGGKSFSLGKFGFNFALTTKSGWLFSVGTFRYDYVDRYFEFPRLAIKRVKG